VQHDQAWLTPSHEGREGRDVLGIVFAFRAIGSNWFILPSGRSSCVLQPFGRINQVHGYALTSGIAEEQPAIL